MRVRSWPCPSGLSPLRSRARAINIVDQTWRVRARFGKFAPDLEQSTQASSKFFFSLLFLLY